MSLHADKARARSLQSLLDPELRTNDARTLAGAKRLHRAEHHDYEGPHADSTWRNCEKKWRWLGTAKLVLDGADLVDPRRQLPSPRRIGLRAAQREARAAAFARMIVGA